MIQNRIFENNMATEIGTGIHEETARELERLRREVLMSKQELRDRFEYYFSVLREKHLEMEAKLDEVVRVAETQVVDRQTQFDQLRITKAEVSQNLIHNKLNETLVSMSLTLDEKIQGLEEIVDQVPSVWLEWRDEWLVGGMAELCRVSEGVSYVNRHNPVCSVVNRGEDKMKYLMLMVSLQTDTMEMCMCVTVWLIGFRCLAEKESIRGPSVHKDCLFLLK